MDANGEPVPAHPPAQRRPGPEHLREPLRGGDGHVGAVLGLRPRAAGRARARTVHSTRRPGSRPATRSRGSPSTPAAGSFPAAYRGALFFGDRLRNCIYAMLPGPDGVPDRGRVVPFAQQAGEPVAIEFAPGGDMLYVDRAADAVRRVSFPSGSANQAPTADAQADATVREPPSDGGLRRLGVERPGRRRRDRVRVGPRRRRRAGRLDRPRSPTFTYMQGGTFTVTLRVTDTSGDSDTDTLDDHGRQRAGRPGSTRPAAGTTWGAGQAISFSGGGTDVDGSALPASALDWTRGAAPLRRAELPRAPDRRLTRTPPRARSRRPTTPSPARSRCGSPPPYSNGQTEVKTAALAPRTVDVSLGATPAGAAVTLNGEAVTAPATHPVVVGSTNTLDAPVSQAVGNTTYRFSSWSDGQQRSRAASRPRATGPSRPRFAPLTPGTQTLTFAPEADARVDEAQPATQLRHREPRCAPTAAHDPDVESFLRFQVAGITGTGDEREAAPAVDHQHLERAGGARHHATAGPRPA